MEDVIAPVIEKCPVCETMPGAGANFCNSCGFPLMGTVEEKSKFHGEYVQKRTDYTLAINEAKNGTKALYWLAGLAFLGNMVIYAINSDSEEGKAYLIAGFIVPLIFLPLAFWSRTKPFAALLTGLILFSTIILADVFMEPGQFYRGIILKVIILYFLIKGVKAGYKATQLQKELETRNWNQ